MNGAIKYIFYKANASDTIWIVTTNPPIQHGSILFSYDKKKIYSFWRDYPDALTKEEITLFDAEFPEWAYYYKHGEFPK